MDNRIDNPSAVCAADSVTKSLKHPPVVSAKDYIMAPEANS